MQLPLPTNFCYLNQGPSILCPFQNGKLKKETCLLNCLMQAVLSVISEMLEIAILIFQDNSNAKLGKVLIFQAKVCKNLAKMNLECFAILI